MTTRLLPATRAATAWKLSLTAGLILSLASCIASDQLTTVLLHPDGSADWMRVQSNVHSTEKGEKGAEEVSRFIADFEARRDPDCVRIREAGGEILEARWVRREEPLATLVTARLPNAAALERLLTYRNDKGEPVVQGSFSREGPRRQLKMSIRLPREESSPAPAQQPQPDRRQEEANGVSETRFAVAGGQITAARGFVVASDKQSALLDPAAIRGLLEAGGGRADLLLEWELAAR
jgi:hypothetical protein